MARLNRLITEYVRSIAEEKTENGPEESIITKAEKLARILWQRALGNGPPGIDSKGKMIRQSVDMAAVSMILDRVEGKVLSTEELQKKDESIPDRISRIGRDKVNKISGEVKNE
jgi:hypothetical protein